MPPSLGCGQQWIETVLTCEGDYYDPDLQHKLTVFNSRLQQILRAEKERLVIKKVEPWNSVKVTLNIPPEAALRLRALAEDGSQALRNLGILAVQVEGDRVISLTLAGNGAGLQRTPAVAASLSSHSFTATTGSSAAVGLSHCSDRSTPTTDRQLSSGVVHKLGSPPPAVSGCLAAAAPPPPLTSLHGQQEPAKRPRKVASRAAGCKKRAVDPGSATVVVTTESVAPSPGLLLAAGTASEVPASLLASSVVPKPRYRHTKSAAASNTARVAATTADAGLAATTALPSKQPSAAAGARSAQHSSSLRPSSAACLVSLVGSVPPSALRAAAQPPPSAPQQPGLGMTSSPASVACTPPRIGSGESVRVIGSIDVTTSLGAPSASRGVGGVYVAADGSSAAAAASATIATSNWHRLTGGRAMVSAGTSAACTAPSGLLAGGTQSYFSSRAAHQLGAVAAAMGAGGSSAGQLGGFGSSSVPHVMAKHLYHPAGEDRHLQEVCRMHSLAPERGSSGSVSTGLLNSRTEPSNCSYESCRGADGLGSCEQQQRSYTAGTASPRRPSSSDHSSHACAPGAPSLMERDSSAAHTADYGSQDSTGSGVTATSGIVRAAGESLLQGHAFATSTLVSSHRSGGDYGIRGQRSAVVEAMRHCESPTVVDHLEGTIMSVVAGDEGDDSAAAAATASGEAFEERDDGILCVVMQDTTVYRVIPPCLDMAKAAAAAADLQSSQDSPMSSPAALAALSKHESASSETETESASSAVSVDSGIASSSPKSDLGETGGNSAANTPGGSEHEAQLLGTAAALRSDAVGDSGASGRGRSATAGRGLWVPDVSTSSSATTAAAQVGHDGNGLDGSGGGGSASALLLPSQDALYRALPTAGGWQSGRGTTCAAQSAGSSALLLREHEEATTAGTHRMLFGGACQGLPNAGISLPLIQESGSDCKPATGGGSRSSRSPYFDQHMRATRSHQTVSACMDADALARDSHGSRRTSVDQPFITIHNMVNVVELQALPTTCRERKRPVNHT